MIIKEEKRREKNKRKLLVVQVSIVFQVAFVVLPFLECDFQTNTFNLI